MSNNQEQPQMKVVGHRPTFVLDTLTSSDGVLVPCRLANGDDAYVPLKTLFALLVKDIQRASGMKK